MNEQSASVDADVVIIGFGPVGQALAALLGRAGHRVLVIERHEQIYRLPRATHFDHEIMRLLQLLGVADQLSDQLIPLSEYLWTGADGEPVMRFELPDPGRSGWASSYMFFQPDLESALARTARAQPDVTVDCGWLAEAVNDTGCAVEVTLRRVAPRGGVDAFDGGETRTVCARWVVGADGANSFVRQAVGIGQRDLGFRERWLVVDVEPHDMRTVSRLPAALQMCDPFRPTTLAQIGPKHRRWEFMLLPGEDPSDFDYPARVWRLLERWLRPEQATLTRWVVYEFGSKLAGRMRAGRTLLVGDAAHLTPPFLGQGMCCGLRDAMNLAWKLDLVLRGIAADDLLDTVELERQTQNEAMISFAVELGKVICQLDPQAAAERDTLLRQAPAPPPVELAALAGGIIHRPAGRVDELAGSLSVQGLVRWAGQEGRFDDVVGAGFQLVVREGNPLGDLATEHLELLEALGMRVVSLDPTLCAGVHDVDGRLSTWLGEHDAHAVLIRPDFYVFGSAPSAAELPALLDALVKQLHTDTRTLSAGAAR